jgi:hypothetical protein
VTARLCRRLKPADYDLVTEGTVDRAVGALASSQVAAAALPFYELIRSWPPAQSCASFVHSGAWGQCRAKTKKKNRAFNTDRRHYSASGSAKAMYSPL